MDSGRRRASAGCLTVVLATLLAAGCVRSKPPRTLVPVATPTSATATLVPEPTKLAEAPESPTLEESYPQTPTATMPYPTITPSPALTLTPAEATPTATVLTPTTTLAAELPTALPPPSTIETPPPAGDVAHVVVWGETLLSIASRYRTTVPAIMSRNALANPNSIFVGQQLVIPVGSTVAQTPMPTIVQHTVRMGETLSQLTRIYRTTVEEILTRNPSITDRDHLSEGTVLSIAVGTAPSVITHQVRYGETISAIARRYRVSVRALVQANGLTDPNRVYVGQVLIIPG